MNFHPRAGALRRMAAVVLAAWACHAAGQAYPDRPVRMIVPFATGGTTDAVARIVAQKVSDQLGQPVVVDNRPGAGGNVGTNLVAKAAPDGYTWAMVGNSFTVNPSLYKSMPYLQTDLQPVVVAGTAPFVFVANPKAPFKTLPELIQYAKANPGAVTYASGGGGTIGHLGSHWLADLANIKMQHIPYKGAGPALTDLVGGQVQVYFDTLTTSVPFIKSGQIRPLFVTTPQRTEAWRDIPTAAEVGYPDLTSSAWVGIVVPAATPKDIVERINREVNAALAAPETRAKLAGIGATPVGGPVSQAQRFMAEETVRWGNVVRSSGAEVQ